MFIQDKCISFFDNIRRLFRRYIALVNTLLANYPIFFMNRPNYILTSLISLHDVLSLLLAYMIVSFVNN